MGRDKTAWGAQKVRRVGHRGGGIAASRACGKHDRVYALLSLETDDSEKEASSKNLLKPEGERAVSVGGILTHVVI